MKVKEAMHTGVQWVTPDTPLREIARLMRKDDIGSIPVGENDKLVGMVTDRDIVCRGIAADGFDLDRCKASDVMSKGIHTCRAEEDLEAALEHMQGFQVRRLPVIDENKRMVGMLGLGDISHAAAPPTAVQYLKSVAAPH